MAGATGKEQLVIACNGFPTKLSTLVGVRRPQHMTKLRAAKAHLAQVELKPKDAKQQQKVKVLRNREKKAKVSAINAEVVREENAAFLKAHPPPAAHKIEPPKTWNLAAELVGVLWTRHLGYGECKEFHIDLSLHELFFVLPGGNASCALDPPLFAEVGVEDSKLTPAEVLAASLTAETPRHLFAVGSQPHADEPRCEVQTVALPNREDSATLKPAELATVDAFTQGSPEKPVGAEAELEEEERKKGLPALAPLDRGAQMRLEDFVQKEVIASEVVGSRTLGLGHAYAVEPKELHLLLEDIRQSRMIDKQDMKFQDGHSYLAMRMGRGGNSTDFPEKLLVYECQECQNDATWMQRLEEDAEVEPVQE